MNATLAPRAVRELTAATVWIARDNRTAARGLRDAIRDAAILIGRHPEIGLERPELSDAPFRFLMVKGYPYLIAYDASRIPPLIARIVHTSRDLPALFETDAP